MAAARKARKRTKRDAKDRVIAELRAQVAALLKRVEDLEAQLRQNSTNSSKPLPKPNLFVSGNEATTAAVAKPAR